MGRKIFVSYKYGDPGVRPIENIDNTQARHYVDSLATMIDAEDHIYKGEDDGEDLGQFTDETIASKLRDKIFDSSLTVVFISKNMKDPSKTEKDQWIPWEISFSLRESSREGRTSKTNAMLAIVLPDENGSYEYFVKNVCMRGCTSWEIGTAFLMLGKNMFNRKVSQTTECSIHSGGGAIHVGDNHSYIYPVKWDYFIVDINKYIEHAISINGNIDDYDIKKIID
ncbi:TIR domain-containing protein [Candidatus Uhrbacteria bacterium]|nr:TIR domain-containing protein [Candidatus Uhrbacteria bacterium]